ncbi:hypothetical protein ASE00_17500 [Sphingomonas sp. Root710]|uniref:hypothetical protein n=1 Tax=Sphingomonas sp. Root710 TaxID=1736594 RepID=UPI0006F3B218|nr:hypothetical protein [Sphingomonas sp. Root710]KRB80814.1 hypothetical protein ASE00_17500 [Sphingomonas sp. Root710]
MTMPAQSRSATQAATPTLSALEWKVVSLAMREAESGSIERRGWLSRWIEGSTGIRPKLPLADPRLETLRRFVGRVRARADVSDLKNRLVEFGFDPGQISAVALIAR